MRRKITAGNWKMNLSAEEAVALVSDLIKNIPSGNLLSEIILAPPFVYLPTLISFGSTTNAISFAAQNCHHEIKGAFTGEVSAGMLRSTGVRQVILGHSERRKYFAEDNLLIGKKVQAVLGAGLEPIFCCGETAIERFAQEQFEVVQKQLSDSLFSLEPAQIEKMILAYEPVWAIGTGQNASPEQAQEMHFFIRHLIRKKFGDSIAEQIPILYGGSCTSENVRSIFSMPDVDGGLVGGASLNAVEFMKIAQSF